MRYGPTGIERNQNEILSGEAPELIAGQLSDLITGRDPRGGNVQLTLVPAVQQAAYSAMTDKGYVGAVVAIEPATGNILALVSSPSYDPNPLASHSDATQRQAYNDLVNADPSPLLNRAIAAVYPPGSTFKLVIAAAALQNGLTPDTAVTGESTITLPGTGGATLSNFGGETCANGGGGDVTLTQALAFSCNTAFAEVAMQLGAPVVRKQADALGVDGQGTDVGLDVVGSRLGDVPDTAALAQTGIGQRDVAVTPFEMAWITATIANRGDRMAPHLIAQTTKPDLTVISQTQPVSLGQAIPIPVADQLRDMMIESEKNTPGSGGIADLVIASKTGTAEHGTDPKNTPPHAWYVAFAPAENPTVAVAVLVENGGDLGTDATGAKVAGPVGRATIAAALAGGS
jgi:peptidoglycan glycosyltransferase